MAITNQIKNFFFLFKREDFTDAEFNDYWLKHHTNLAQQVDPSIHRIIIPNFYQEPEKTKSYGSALVETYHSDEAALKRLFDEPAFNQLINEEPNFVCPIDKQAAKWESSTKLVATTEEVIVDRANKPAFGKLIMACKCAPRSDRDNALESWRQAIREGAKRVLELVGYIESLPMKPECQAPRKVQCKTSWMQSASFILPMIYVGTKVVNQMLSQLSYIKRKVLSVKIQSHKFRSSKCADDNQQSLFSKDGRQNKSLDAIAKQLVKSFQQVERSRESL